MLVLTPSHRMASQTERRSTTAPTSLVIIDMESTGPVWGSVRNA